MMKVLINAYAISPNMGSEQGIAWNWCVRLARHCELFIITEGEFRDKIESELPNIQSGHNMHFYYIPVTEKIRRMCWNQGDWRFYWYYKKWQKKALQVAKSICEEQKIDIIHHLNMTCYREPGYLWKIKGPKYVWGPVDGMNLCPINYIKGIDRNTTLKYRIKNLLNWIQFRHDRRVKLAARHADFIFCDSQAGVDNFKKVYGVDTLQMNESGCTVREDIKPHIIKSGTFDIVWVGRFIPTKMLDLALRSIALLGKEYDIKIHILGTGILEPKYREIANQISVADRCVWHGMVPHDEVEKIMRESDLFFFTSVMEGTPACIMESISNGLPILCFDICGFGPLVDQSIGYKIPLSNPEESAKQFAQKIRYLYENRSVLQKMSNNCSVKKMSISWESLAEKLINNYYKLLNNNQYVSI